MEIFDGAGYRINIVGADSTVILDSYTRTIMANLTSSEGVLLLDQDLGEFYGDLKGNIRNVYGGKILDIETSHISIETIYGNIVNALGEIVYDAESNTIKCSLIGNLYAADGTQIMDVENGIWRGNVQGSILDETGTVIFDNETGAITKDVIGNIFDSNGHIAYDYYSQTFTGNFVGSFVDTNGETFYNPETQILKGNLHGDVIGNLINSAGEVIFNSEDKTANGLHGSFNGTFCGDLLNLNGDPVYFSDTNRITAERGQFKEIIGDLTGNVYGNLMDPLTGEKYFDVENGHLKDVSITGYLYSSRGLEVYDPTQNTLSASHIYTDNLNAAEINLPFVKLNKDGIRIDIDKVFSEPGLELRFYREFEPPIPTWMQIGVELCMASGSYEHPKEVNPGAKLPGLVFSCAIDTEVPSDDDSTIHPSSGADLFRTKSYAAAIYAQLPKDVSFTPELREHGVCGDLKFVTSGYNSETHVMTYDHMGKLHTCLAEINTDGETGVEPSNITTPDSWLQITVNGETKFLPLYS